MSSKTICDICKKEIKAGNHLRFYYDLKRCDYCEGCWRNKKNWKKIHNLQEETPKIKK
jgi:hypothetical protein